MILVFWYGSYVFFFLTIVSFARLLRLARSQPLSVFSTTRPRTKSQAMAWRGGGAAAIVRDSRYEFDSTLYRLEPEFPYRRGQVPFSTCSPTTIYSSAFSNQISRLASSGKSPLLSLFNFRAVGAI
ncbi:hypothetical protein BDV19DRAFT_368557 [Aspergillus venezuelensis]